MLYVMYLVGSLSHELLGFLSPYRRNSDHPADQGGIYRPAIYRIWYLNSFETFNLIIILPSSIVHWFWHILYRPIYTYSYPIPTMATHETTCHPPLMCLSLPTIIQTPTHS